jgi:7-cyano-7-deazaguanine reductase
MKKRTKKTAARPKATPLGYSILHAETGKKASLPRIDTWPNQYSGYEIRVDIPEYTAICPKTKLPDFGTITIEYLPDRECLELKSLKNYILRYRNIGIFYENAVPRILEDVVKATNPRWAVVTGKFTPRGGMRSTIVARYGPAPGHERVEFGGPGEGPGGPGGGPQGNPYASGAGGSEAGGQPGGPGGGAKGMPGF